MHRKSSALAPPSSPLADSLSAGKPTGVSSLVPERSWRSGLTLEDVVCEWDGCDLATTAEPLATPATFLPEGYEAGYAYPLIVWMHGAASDERTLASVMRHVSVRNFVAVAPRGVECHQRELVEDGVGTATWRQTTPSIEHAEEAVLGAIDSATERFNVHPGRVFLAGVGAGGTMALRVALRHAHRFAGVATLDGPMPVGRQPLAKVNEVRDLPLLLSAGRKSTRYPESLVCGDLALLHSAGCKVSIRQYPEDDLTTPMLADLNRWLMDLVCG